jgi:hypothetical protein
MEVQMMEDNYSKAYKEIVEILKYVPEESVNKIPKEMRDMFEAEQLKTYNFQIDTEKTFEEQELLEETKAILANIFRDYWATDYQKARIIEKENQDREEWERQKREKYNPNDIFKNRNTTTKDNDISQDIQEQLNEEYNKNLPMEVQKQNIFQRLLSFIKKLIRH